MASVSRILSGRDYWRGLAVKRRKDAESKARQAAKWKKRCQEAETLFRTLQAENASLMSQLSQIPTPVVHIHVRVVCVFIFFLGVVSCRSVPRILSFLADIYHICAGPIPHYSSVVNWVCRAGLGLLERVGQSTERWVAIIDTSISYSKKKVLVVIRVPLNHFHVNNTAPKLSDVECVGIELGDTWNYETINASLERVFERAGNPVAILKDGGADLAKGVSLWSSKNKPCKEIRDIGHVVANELKRHYKRNHILEGFLKLVNQGKSRLCQTQLAFLKPPKIRTKGRFQGISKVVQWAERILSLVSASGQAKKESMAGKLRKALPGLGRYRLFISHFARDCLILNRFMQELKKHGLNQNTYLKAKKILNELPQKSPIKKNLLQWLEKHLRLQCLLAMGQTPLLVSSDSIETFMGNIKNIIARNPLQEFGNMILAAPLFCGKHTPKEIEQAILQISHKKLKQWQEQNTHNTMRKEKRKIFPPQPKQKMQDPPIATAA